MRRDDHNFATRGKQAIELFGRLNDVTNMLNHMSGSDLAE